MRVCIEGNIASGKCLGYGEKVLMFSGVKKESQDIVAGDVLMGDDSEPRTVLDICTGRAEMFKVIPHKGLPFLATQNHILCVKVTFKPFVTYRADKSRYVAHWFDSDRIRMQSKNFVSPEEAAYHNQHCNHPETLDISIDDYLRLRPQDQYLLKTYRVGVNFPHKEPIFDPYIIGYWLGDGTTGQAEITTADLPIVEAFQERLQRYGLEIRCRGKYRYRILCEGARGANTFCLALRELGIFTSKAIPDQLKYTSRAIRLSMLAGLLDSDGHLARGCFEITQKSAKLAGDIVFLARSLGFACFPKAVRKSCVYKGERRVGTYYRMIISGEGLEDIPTILKRKRASPRQQVKDALRTSFRVEAAGIADYYGFETDGNHRFLLGDFTVTHNSSVLHELEKTYDVYPEAVKDWQGLLTLFYEDQQRWAFALAAKVLLSFSNIPQKGMAVVERSPLSNKEVFSRLHKNEGILAEKEWLLLQDLHSLVGWQPDVIIYLKCPPKVCMERLVARQREGEDLISMEYLSKLQFAHQTMLKYFSGELHVVDASKEPHAVASRVKDIMQAYGVSHGHGH